MNRGTLVLHIVPLSAFDVIFREARRHHSRAEVPPSRVQRMPPPLASNPHRFHEDRSEIAHDIAHMPSLPWDREMLYLQRERMSRPPRWRPRLLASFRGLRLQLRQFEQ
jgi:hypothetical protein